MRRKAATAQLKEVVAMRELQRLCAQAATMAAARAAQASRVAVQERNAERDAAAENCLASLSSDAIHPELTMLWTRVLRRLGDDAQRAASDARDADAELLRRSADFAAATARRDAAQDLARKAHKQDMRKHEDGGLQDALDRHAQQKRRM